MARKRRSKRRKPLKDAHAFTLRFGGTASRIISTVGLTPVFDQSEVKDNKFPYDIINFQGLWDTGATNSVVTPATVQALGLTPVGTTRVTHVGGEGLTNTYLVNIFLPNYVIIGGVLVTETSDIINDFGLIIGMDVIAQGDFALTNLGGKTCMSYRYPSIRDIDFVEDYRKVQERRKKGG